MQKDVVVVEQKEYDEWFKEQASYYESVVKPTLATEEKPAEKVQALLSK